ncbi:MAG: Kelch repeat-containing protein, partial [Candidatus Kariarchaeaceae archaeon]
LTHSDHRDIFLAKYDAIGDFVWALGVGGTGWDQVRSIDRDVFGNIFLSGFFSGTIDFDPGPATSNLTSAGDWDIFAAKYDNSGNYKWAIRAGSNEREWSMGITADVYGNAHLTGAFPGTVDFDPGPGAFNLTSLGWTDIFVLKLNSPIPNQPPDCSGATIADQVANVNCPAIISGSDVTGVTDPENDPLNITVNPSTLSLGPNTVTVVADDGSGGMCSTDITVNVVTSIESWTPTSITDAPSGRIEFEAVWTGSKMLVWEQANQGNGGGIYDLATDTWTEITTVNAPSPVPEDYVAIWTGSTMIVWSGWGGAIYDPVADSWTPISTPNPNIAGEFGVWTGSSMIVWSGGGQGGIYDPVTDTWTFTSQTNSPTVGHDGTAVWTGSKMIVWGGKGGLNTGVIYDLATDSWTPTSTLSAPSGREEHTAIWTGSKMIIWGGATASGITNTGGIYDPVTDTWVPTSMVNAPAARAEQVAVWTGSRMVVWSGFGPGDSSGGIYDPETDTWMPTPTCNAPFPRKEHVGFWSSATNELIVWGGSNTVIGGITNTGGRYGNPVIGRLLGSIAGTVSSGGTGLENILVSLHDNNGNTLDDFPDVFTDANGEYSFVDVPVGNYQVMIVEPLGYIVDDNPKLTTVIANETSIVDFDLTEILILNNARSKGYWKHQFDVYLRGNGNTHESEEDLIHYIDLVHEHYTLYYDIFTDVNTFEEWQTILSLTGNQPMAERAKQHLAALILNMVSEKIGQNSVVTDDGRDVGDVIQHVSLLIIDPYDSNDELAKDLAESVNNQQMIAAGLVDEGSIIFKTGDGSKDIDITTYKLFDNYPNPFNPNTTIVYQIPNAGFVTLKVYDMLGNNVVTLVNENKGIGQYNITFDASALSSGVYIYQLKVNDYLSTKKMLLMK